jgi:hypothetical protein
VGFDAFILVVWAAQAFVVFVLVLRAAFARRWFAGVGLVLGLAVGLSPLVAGQNVDSHRGTVVFGISIILVLLSAIVLIAAYGFGRRWVALALTIAIFGIPVPYILLASNWFPSSSTSTILKPLEILGQFDFLLAPVACALACQEILAWVGRLVTHSKERMA